LINVYIYILSNKKKKKKHVRNKDSIDLITYHA